MLGFPLGPLFSAISGPWVGLLLVSGGGGGGGAGFGPFFLPKLDQRVPFSFFALREK